MTFRYIHIAPNLLWQGVLRATSLPSPWCGGLLLNHAGILKHVGPFPTRPLVAVLEMLSEVVCSVKLLGRVALPELVNVLQVANSIIPVLCSDEPGPVGCHTRTMEIAAAISARVGGARPARRFVECAIVARKRRARPRVTANVE